MGLIHHLADLDSLALVRLGTWTVAVNPQSSMLHTKGVRLPPFDPFHPNLQDEIPQGRRQTCAFFDSPQDQI